jgi:hypothetical protein
VYESLEVLLTVLNIGKLLLSRLTLFQALMHGVVGVVLSATEGLRVRNGGTTSARSKVINHIRVVKTLDIITVDIVIHEGHGVDGLFGGESRGLTLNGPERLITSTVGNKNLGHNESLRLGALLIKSNLDNITNTAFVVFVMSLELLVCADEIFKFVVISVARNNNGGGLVHLVRVDTTTPFGDLVVELLQDLRIVGRDLLKGLSRLWRTQMRRKDSISNKYSSWLWLRTIFAR